MPRRSVVDARATRIAILDRAVAVASTDGLEGVTIGRLATDLSMSKAGVIGHFGTKEALQLAALEDAAARFAARPPQPSKPATSPTTPSPGRSPSSSQHTPPAPRRPTSSTATPAP